MRIIDEYTLASFRRKQLCEWCQARGPVQPHHLWGRGMGGATRLDVKVNLIALCVRCHQEVHQGNILRVGLLAIVANREGRQQGDVIEEIHRLRRCRNDPGTKETGRRH